MNKYQIDLTSDEREILSLADEMAGSMTDLNSQTYDSFISAREKFRTKLKEMSDKKNHAEEQLRKIKETVLSL